MPDYSLSKREIAELRAAHRRVLNVREAYRINAVILLGQGRTAVDVADALLIDLDTVRNYCKRYRQGGIERLLRMNFVGSEALLDAAQLAELDTHLQSNLYQTAESVARWVKEHWGGMLRRQRHGRGPAPSWLPLQEAKARPRKTGYRAPRNLRRIQNLLPEVFREPR